MPNASGNALRKGLPSILNSFPVDSSRRASLSLLDSVLATVGQLFESGCVITLCYKSLSLLDSVLATVGQLFKSGWVISYCECNLT